MAQKAAWLHGAERVIAIDPVEYRLAKAREANKVETLNAHDENLMEKIREMTGGRGTDCTIDAVGMEAERGTLDKLKAVLNLEKGTPSVLENCFEAVRRGGNVSVVGVYGSNYDNFPVHQLFEKGLTVRFGQAYVVHYIQQLFEIVRQGKVKLNDIITHRLPLADAARAYDIFKKKEDDCVKVVLKP
jgi:alcohol dehydrogenase